MRIVAGLALIATSAFPPIAAANDPGPAGTAIVTGRCTKMIIGAENQTASCEGQLANVTLADGTIMFVFTAKGRMIAFWGDGRRVSSNGSQGRLPLIVVGIGASGGQPEVAPADGVCEYTDPHAGVATINCTATTEFGAFVAMFQTDGKAPRTQ